MTTDTSKKTKTKKLNADQKGPFLYLFESLRSPQELTFMRSGGPGPPRPPGFSGVSPGFLRQPCCHQVLPEPIGYTQLLAGRRDIINNNNRV